MNDFVGWLNRELQSRGWPNSEIAKRAGVANSTVSMILSGKSKPGWDFCAGVAQALGESPDKVFRLAGLLPPLPEVDATTTEELLSLFKTLSPQDRKEVVAYARFRQQRAKEKDRG